MLALYLETKGHRRPCLRNEDIRAWFCQFLLYIYLRWRASLAVDRAGVVRGNPVKYSQVRSIAAALLLAGCTTTSVHTSKTATISWTEPEKRVVVMDPDVELGELGASGIVDWRADWTKTGKDFVDDDVHADLVAHGIQIVDSGKLTDEHATQLEKLHGAVGDAILLHVVTGGNFALPTKTDPLDYTLGPGVRTLRDKYDADYALFIRVRDTYSSPSRKALQVAGMLGAIVGVAIVVPGGQQVAYASLVDLKTGNVVWFNLLRSGSGDLREASSAQSAVGSLLQGLPL